MAALAFPSRPGATQGSFVYRNGRLVPGPPGVTGVTPGPIGPNTVPPFVAPTPSQVPTFQPSAQTNFTDQTGEIQRLIQALQQQMAGTGGARSGVQSRISGLIQSPNIRAPRPVNLPAAPDFSRFDAQQAELQQTIAKLLRGEGIDIGDISQDPEAASFRVARQREAERQRTAEAERLAASGLTGSGDFDVRVGQVGEAAAEDIAGFQAGLAGRRRGEAIAGATTAASLSLQDLQRQAQQEQTRFQAELGAAQLRSADEQAMFQALMAQEQLKRQGALGAAELELSGLNTDLGSQQTLLNALLGERGRAEALAQQQAQFGSTVDFQRAQLELQQRLQALQEQLLQQELRRGNQQLRGSSGRRGSGVVGRGF